VNLRHTGTPPGAVRRAALLPIEKNVPPPSRMARGVLRNTLIAMVPGDSIVVLPSSVANVYARAKCLNVKVQVEPIKEGEHKGKYRVWKMA